MKGTNQLDPDDQPAYHLQREPRLQQARDASLMAHAVLVKLKELGLPEDLDDALGRLCTDLGDLWNAQKALTDQLESFLSSDEWNDVGDNLVDLRSSIDHMAWHMKSVRRPMGQITRFAYRKGRED